MVTGAVRKLRRPLWGKALEDTAGGQRTGRTCPWREQRNQDHTGSGGGAGTSCHRGGLSQQGWVSRAAGRAVVRGQGTPSRRGRLCPCRRGRGMASACRPNPQAWSGSCHQRRLSGQPCGSADLSIRESDWEFRSENFLSRWCQRRGQAPVCDWVPAHASGEWVPETGIAQETALQWHLAALHISTWAMQARACLQLIWVSWAFQWPSSDWRGQWT